MTKIFPSDLDLAISLFLIQIKPDSTSIDEFLSLLRDQLQPGAASYLDPYYLDGVNFWKQRYSSLQKDVLRLQVQLDAIERPKILSTTRGDPLDHLVQSEVLRNHNLAYSAVLDVLYLLRFHKTASTRTGATDELRIRLCDFLAQEVNLDVVTDLLRLTMTILHRKDVFQCSRDHCTRLMLSLVGLIRLMTIKLIDAPGNDCREPLLNFVIGIIDLVDAVRIFDRLLELLADCLELDTRVAHHVSYYYLRLIAELPDTGKYYILVQHFKEYTELARDIWHLGVIKGWIVMD